MNRNFRYVREPLLLTTETSSSSFPPADPSDDKRLSISLHNFRLFRYFPQIRTQQTSCMTINERVESRGALIGRLIDAATFFNAQDITL